MSVAPFTIVCIAVTLAPAIAWAQPLAFQRDDAPSTRSARGIAAADFNRDGWIDLVTAHHDPDGVAVLLNRGPSGGYTHSFIALAGGPFDVVTGDLNKDGLPDIAVANADANAINLLFGRPEGGFAAPVDLPGGANPRSLAVADIDRDGNPDVIFTEFAGARATIYWGDGTGSFVSRAPAVLSTVANPQGVAVADFNIDGRPDIVTVATGGFNIGVTIHFAETAAGAFTRWTIEGTQQQNVVTVGDFDKDGRPDIAAAGSSTSNITTLMNTRAGWSIRAFAAGGASPRGIATADLNRDGALDLVAGARGTSTILIARGIGDGRFAAPEAIPAGGGSRAVVTGDFDHDGRVDVASGNEYASAVTVLSNTTAFPRAGFKFRRQVLGPGTDTSSSGEAVDVADFDHDGRLDAVTSDAGIHVRFGDGRAVTLAAFGMLDVAAVDVNGDGHTDIVGLTQGSGPSDPSRIETFFGDGTGAFPSRRTTATGLIGVDIVLGDFNGDARTDLILTGRTDWAGAGRMQVYSGNPDGSFARVSDVAMEESPWMTAGDVDRDGDLDLVHTSRGLLPSGARVLTRLNEGSLRFGTPREAAVPNFSGIRYSALGDLNHDGFLDYAGQGFPHDWSTHERIAVLLGGAAGFGAPTYLRTTETGLGVAIGDLTMDGDPDIITHDGVLFRGGGDGSFAGPELFEFYGPSPRIVDFDGDGLPDVVVPTDQGSVELILNQPGEENTPPTVDLGRDFSIEYRYQFGDGELEFWARTTDPDLHKPTFRWRMPDGTVVDSGTFPFMGPIHMDPGRHEYGVEVSDGRGGTASDVIVVTVLPEKEIALHVGVEWWSQPHSPWQLAEDPSAASGRVLRDVNAGAPKITTPSPNPAGYVDVSFIATNTETYKVWVRLKADGNHWANDSLWLQFSGAVDANGRSYAPGTASGIEINLEECSGCGVSGWGWRDEAWGQRDAIGVLTLKFEKNGWQTLRIQTREDGVAIDQVVLSSEKYRTARPGATKNDTTILPGTFYW